MDQLFKTQLKKLIVSHENYKNHPYVDTVGKITIGIGYNLTDRGLPDAWINQQYEDDVNYFYQQLNNDYTWFKDLSDARKMVLIDMCFMGYKSFQTFKKMLFALSMHNYERAADEMLNSKWAQQVKSRAVENALIMRRGELCSQQVS